ncbi:MAG: helix-turn-helix transcriptional regulator [Clostridia bacterium]|nr:helix-turn-helix transcriptional regulator [Clostridia bacterium]
MKNANRESLYEQVCHKSENLPMKIYHTSGVNLHWHEEYEFIMVKNGSVSCVINGKAFDLTENKALLVHSGELHSIQSCSGAKIIAIVVSSTMWEDEMFGSIFKEPIKFSSVFSYNTPLGHCVIEILDQITEIYDDKKFGYGFLIKAKFLELFSLFIESQSFTYVQKNASRLPDEMKNLMNYVHEHFAEKISLCTLSSVSFYSQTYIINLFKRYTNLTPTEYIIQYRLEIAKEKLRNTTESNVDIALSCGFNSETYFIRAFKKLYGITPFVYRKQQKSP